MGAFGAFGAGGALAPGVVSGASMSRLATYMARKSTTTVRLEKIMTPVGRLRGGDFLVDLAMLIVGERGVWTREASVRC